jgi:hypothetical protein
MGPSGPDLKAPWSASGRLALTVFDLIQASLWAGHNNLRSRPNTRRSSRWASRNRAKADRATRNPLHKDGGTIVKERIYLDKVNPDLLHDDVTVFDHALTRPWTVNKTYGREPDKERPFWQENNCGEYNNHVKIGTQNYLLSADGPLMPIRKNQPAPDLRYFNQSAK